MFDSITKQVGKSRDHWIWASIEQHYREVIDNMLPSRMSFPDWKKFMFLVFEEIKNAAINLQYVQAHRNDPFTLEACLQWANRHIGIAITKLNIILACVLIFTDCRKLVSQELEELWRAAYNLRQAQVHTDDPAAFRIFLSSAEAHINNAIALHDRLLGEFGGNCLATQ